MAYSRSVFFARQVSARSGNDALGGLLAAVDRVGDADAVPGVSVQVQARQGVNASIDRSHALEAPYGVLGHRPPPPDDPEQAGLRPQAQQFGQLLDHDPPDGLVLQIDHFRPAGTAEKNAEQYVPFGGPTREFHAREANGQDPPPFDIGDDQPEAVEWMGHLLPPAADQGQDA